MAHHDISTPPAGAGGECLRAAPPRTAQRRPRRPGQPRAPKSKVVPCGEAGAPLMHDRESWPDGEALALAPAFLDGCCAMALRLASPVQPLACRRRSQAGPRP